MDNFDKYCQQAERLGYKDEDLRNYVQQCIEREERYQERLEKEKQREREEKEKEREREFELQKLEAEKEKERLKAEKEDKERQYAKEQREFEDRVAERAFKLRQLELETDAELRKLQIPKDNAQAQAQIQASHVMNQPKSYIPKLPPFDENKDDIDSFLFRFEQHATTCSWPKDKWTLYVASLFKGSALVLYHSLAAKETLTWTQLKDELLKKFQCTADGFRERFRGIRPDKGESFPSFLIRMTHHLDRWIELSESEKDFPGLRDLLLREQLLQSVSKDLAVFLRERKFTSAEEMCKAADQYRLAHPEKQIGRKGETTIFDTNVASSPAGMSNRGHNVFYQHRVGQSGSQGRGRGQFRGGQAPQFSSRGSFSRPARGRGSFFQNSGFPTQSNPTAQSGTSGPGVQIPKVERRCYHCEGKFHIRSRCPFLKGKTSNVATKEEVTCVLAPEVSVSGLKVEDGSVNGFTCSVLRDTGCTTAGVRKSLVNDNQYVGKMQKCRTFGGKIEQFPLANIQVDTPYYSGEIIACVIDNPVCDFILGNLPGVSSVHGGDGGSFVPCLVSTRSQEDKDRQGQKPLKVPDLTPLKVTPQTLSELQRQDESLTALFDLVSEVVSEDAKPYFLMQDHVLFRICRKNDQEIKQIVVPKGLRETVLCTGHDAIFAGHCGVKRTLQRVTKSFFWPGVRKDVTDYCRSCDICQKTIQKGRVPCAPLHKMPVISVPFQRVAIDLIGPFQVSSAGNRYVLTVVDMATRFPEAVPLKKIDTVTVAEALLSIFARVGLPQEILSDCGTQFVSDLMQEVYRLLSISSVTTTPYHPQSNGMVERFNGTLKSMLRKISLSQPREWDRYIPALLFAYRELPNETLGFSPFELLFGHSPRGPLDLLANHWTKPQENDVKNVYQYVYDLYNRIRDTCDLAQECVKQKTAVYKHFADRKAKHRSLSVGDKVLVLLTDEHNKLRVMWKGPFTIVQKLSPVNYKICMKGQEKIFHINMLKKYVERTDVVVNLSVVDDINITVENVIPMSVIISPDFVPDISCTPSSDAHSAPLEAAVGMLADDDQDLSTPLVTLSVKGETFKDVKIADDLSGKESEELKSLFKDFQDVLTDVPGSAKGVQPHTIHLTSEEPVRVKPYPLPFAKKCVVEKEIKVMLDLGVIEPSSSPYSAPVVLVDKPDGSVRFCIDYRQLNKVTVFDAEPIPDIEEILCQISQGKFFVKIDLTKGYWQIPMAESDKEKTAFQTPFGLFQWTRMPFGLQNAPATFARMMRSLHLDDFQAVNFFDDVLLALRSWSALLTSLRAVLHRLRLFGLTARPSKLQAGFRSLEFLGHTISAGRMMPEQKKISKILALRTPSTKKQVRSLLGLLSYYRRYVPDFASLTAPLTDLVKGNKNRHIQWSEACQLALDRVQQILNSFPVLLLPSLSQDFVLRTDASSRGMGAVLLQHADGLLHPVQYASKKFSAAQQKYSTIERECLAILWACQKFARYLIGREFVLQTDHRPLTFLQSSKTKNNRLLRWALALQEFRFRIQPVPGTTNVMADLLSRE